MSIKRTVGYLLISPIIIIPTVVVGAHVLRHPFVMLVLGVFAAFLIGSFLVFLDDEDKKEAKRRKKR